MQDENESGGMHFFRGLVQNHNQSIEIQHINQR